MRYNKFSTFKTPQELHRFLLECDKIKTINVFDWDRAIQLIKNHNIKTAMIGLKEDWSCNHGFFYKDDDFCFNSWSIALDSIWATPILLDVENDKEYECFRVISRYEEDEV